MEYDVITELTESEIAFIDNEIVNYNLSKLDDVGELSNKAMNLVIKDETGKIIAGLLGQKYYMKAAYIDVLWVDESQRHKHLGTKLLKKFEELAKENGCFMIHLDTFNFQAPEFYEKHGYLLYGTLDNNPVGHKRFYYYKLLDSQI
jgi:ribosomal protein S18 acetylase RimI-like enzyme